jgi:CheY-like chemotaxis protein
VFLAFASTVGYFSRAFQGAAKDMTELTPRDDIKKKVSEILKRVDRLIRAGELDQSIREIIQAKEIDPRNVYIFAYEERLAHLKDEHEKHILEEQTRKAAEEAARKRDEEARRLADEELERLKQEEQHRQELRRQQETRKRELKPQEIDRPPTQPPKEPPPEQSALSLEELERELREAEAELRRKEEEAKKQATKTIQSDRLVKYKNELLKAWEDGTLTPFEETQLAEFQTKFGITPEENARLTKEAQLESYLQAFRQSWSSGSITPERASELSDLRTRFQITPEESDRLEAEILWEVRAEAQPTTLAIIDDDVKFLKVVSETLREAKFNVRSFSTSDDAFKYLKDSKPDLIISDINLETSTMGGFSFYEKVRELDHLHNVPFIFLSGLTDEVLIRTGKELGVDDYLTKPFSDETLLATIRGKLKRFKKLSEMAARKK